VVTAPRQTGRAGPSPGAFAGDVVDRLRAAFEPAADPVRAAGAAAYLRHQFLFLGSPAPGRRFGYCRLRAGDREFFVRKAIGWALRRYAAVNPAPVEAFVAASPELSRRR
jgi:hypothetical protein